MFSFFFWSPFFLFNSLSKAKQNKSLYLSFLYQVLPSRFTVEEEQKYKECNLTGNPIYDKRFSFNSFFLKKKKNKTSSLFSFFLSLLTSFFFYFFSPSKNQTKQKTKPKPKPKNKNQKKKQPKKKTTKKQKPKKKKKLDKQPCNSNSLPEHTDTN